MSVYAVFTKNDANIKLAAVLDLYGTDGPEGRYICCSNVEQNGEFVELTIEPPPQPGNSLVVSIPTEFVGFILKSDTTLPTQFCS